MNTSGCLGVGDNLNSLEPRCIESFNGKKIVGMSAGCGPHVLVLTEGLIIFLNFYDACVSILVCI